jgi:hypothetical protein
MFNRAIRTQTLLKFLSSDHDPLYRFHQWQANLRVLERAHICCYPTAVWDIPSESSNILGGTGNISSMGGHISCDSYVRLVCWREVVPAQKSRS